MRFSNDRRTTSPSPLLVSPVMSGLASHELEIQDRLLYGFVVRSEFKYFYVPEVFKMKRLLVVMFLVFALVSWGCDGGTKTLSDHEEGIILIKERSLTEEEIKEECPNGGVKIVTDRKSVV